MVHDLFESDAFETMADILRGLPVDSILDIGAHVGSSSSRLLESFPGARIFAFEPVGEAFDRLSSRYDKDQRVEPVCLAVGDRNGAIEILVNGQADTSSVLPPTDACLRYHGDKVREIRRERVNIVRLDDWAAQQNVGTISAMKIDVQGLELEALRGAEGLLRASVLAVISEAQLAPIYEGAATFSEIDLFLRDCGFVLHQVCRIASGGPERRTTCCDALWVRADAHQRYVERIAGDALVATGVAS